MRRTPVLPLLPWLLILAPACEGSYVLGDIQQSSAGTSSTNDEGGAGGRVSTNGGGHAGGNGSAVSGSTGQGGGNAGGAHGGSANIAGTSGTTAGSGGEAGGGEAGSENVAGTGGTGPTTHGRWLASETFVSSASTQTQLSLIDLTNPSAAPVVLNDLASPTADTAALSVSVNAFSPDGRWLMYDSFHSDQTRDVFLLDVTRDLPLQTQLVLTTGSSLPCKWAQDSSRVACIEEPTSTDAIGNVVVFDTTGASPGAKTKVGSVLPQSAGAAVNSERELTFLDSNNLVYSYGPNDFARVTWQGQTPSAPVQVGLGGGTIVQQSPDGRLVVKRTNPSYPLGTILADFRLGQATIIDSPVSLGVSTTFEAAYGISAPPATDMEGFGTYVYDWISGTQLIPIGQEAAERAAATFNFGPVFVGHELLHTKGDQVALLELSPTDFNEQIVPGTYSNVNHLELDSTGAWIYVGTAEYDAQQHVIPSSVRHLVSHVTASGPSEVQLLAQGFDAGRVSFSPNGRKVMLSGYDTSLSAVSTFEVFDLTDPAGINTYVLDLPYSWADVGWSNDSRYISLIGGTIEGQARPLYIVDANAPTKAPRLITTCGNGSVSPSPACPALATFQP